jgi:alkylation response protein AidB-like acyl-CoA dehydrogenase
MDFGFSAEQEQLLTTVEDFLGRRAPVSYARSMMDDPVGIGEDVWREISELGWLALAIPEAHGGIGLGWLELAIVMEAMGKVVFPGPFMSTACLATPAVVSVANSEQRERLLPGMAEGALRGTLAVAEEAGDWSAAGVRVEAVASDAGFVLSGTKLFVADADGADFVIVAARLDDGVGLFEVQRPHANVCIAPMSALDQTRKLSSVVMTDLHLDRAALLGDAALTDEAFDGLLDLARTMLAAESCGLAARALELSVDYVQIREQFGRPIGTFQALQHKLADMKVTVENARSLTYYAAWTFDDSTERSNLPAAMAKAYASEGGMRVVADAIQVHGGVGFTWEHDLQIYFKRAKSNELTLGDATIQRARIADLLEL